MAGLCVLLETHEKKNTSPSNERTQVLNKISLMSPKPTTKFTPMTSSSRPASGSASFLDECFLCRQKLLPGKDIYMYKGDKGFCSVECRCRQIFMDEQESVRRENHCAFTAMKKPSSSSSSSSSSPTTPPMASARHHRKVARADRTTAARFVY